MSVQRAIRRHHSEWLSLLEHAGPFLTIPVLSRIWPAGLDPIPRELMDEARPAFETWREDPLGDQRRWIEFVLADFLGWRECLVQGPDLPPGLELIVPEHGATIRADFAFRTPSGELRLLGMVLGPATQPTARATGGWSASAADRLAILLRKHQVPLGLATDGRWWGLVWAPPEGATSVTLWDAALWLEEKETLAALRCLLERRRFLGVADSETLPQLLEAGLAQQEEITITLGRQVRQAVEMLVEAIGRSGRHGGPAEELLAAVEPDEIYHGAVTVMMRLLFLLFAEERLLLPADDELYLASYSAGRLVDELRAEANLIGEEALELRTSAWQRLLSLFRGIHGGIAHDRIHIRAYGGVVFEPDRHPWLEGRTLTDPPENARVLPIDDRTVLHALEALQYITVSGERRRLSFRTLDVEQIGYVYEGLLGYDAVRAGEPVLGLDGKAGEEPEIALSELESIGDDRSRIAELTGLSAPKVNKLLGAEGDLQRDQLLRVACSGDENLTARVRPFAGLLRLDLRGLPVVIPAGGLYVTVSPRRRLSGTHYTPRDLAEKVVISALEPLVYSPGPLDTDDRSDWRRRSSDELLSVKVADIAMGSGAFLVSACRYLAGALLEAWAAEGDVRAIEHLQGEQTLPVDPESDPVVIDARRQIIEHCLYGGDINEMAVEMAKLSLWLVSLSRERPFSFLDDRLVCGDSLIGLTSIEQLRTLHLNPAEARKIAGDRGFDLWGKMRATLDELERLRQAVADRPLNDLRDSQMKSRLLNQADQASRPLSVIADALIGAAIAGEDLLPVAQSARDVLREADEKERDQRVSELANTAAYKLDTDRPDGAFARKPTHWPLVFPEVFAIGGFDAVIGNPPFLGGKKITSALGSAYREFLVRHVAQGARGNADLVAYFLLVAHELLNAGGQTGLIGTNTMAQGETREVGLDRIIASGTTIRAAVKSAPWPTRTVNLQYSVLWSTRHSVAQGVQRRVDGQPFPVITTALDGTVADLGKPFRLVANRSLCGQGSILLGIGFTLEPNEARALIERNPRNRDVLFPFLTGEDLASQPNGEPTRWVINFDDWPLEAASRYPDCLEIVEDRVKPLRDLLPEAKAKQRSQWWKYEYRAAQLYKRISGLRRVLAIALTSKIVMPQFVPNGLVYFNSVGVFAYEDYFHLALLSSSLHYWWAITYASTLESRIRYTPGDVFETFPQPKIRSEIAILGEELESLRRTIMRERMLGLTDLYNLVHDPEVDDDSVAALRNAHVDVDRAVASSYGWEDIQLGHDYHTTRQGLRFTIADAARRELLTRLLELNHQRHADEVARGLTAGKGRSTQSNASQMDLVEA